MKYLDERKKQLEEYLPPLTKEPDFDEFWERKIKENRAVPLNAEMILREDYPIESVKVYDVWMDSCDGKTRIHGVYITSATDTGKRPILICYHGYTWYGGLAHSYVPYVDLGMDVLTMDERMQNGQTTEGGTYSSGSIHPYTHGILDPDEYYVTRANLDGLKAVDFACTLPNVDKDYIFTNGGSQGGAMAFTVACLDNRVSYCFCDVPSNTNIEARIEGQHGTFGAVMDYIRVHPETQEAAYRTVSYIDNMNLADRCRAAVYAVVGLKDNTCPAKCFYAAYNRVTSEKHIDVYPFAGHEGGGDYGAEKKLYTIAKILKDKK